MAATSRIHPTAVVGPDVEIGSGNVIGPYAVVVGHVSIGDDNWIGPHAVVGAPAQMRGGLHPAPWDEDPGNGRIVIGSGNVIREFVTVHLPDLLETRIGDRAYIMTQAHVPHDAVIGNDVTLSNSVQIGGHADIGDGANLGLNTTVHQRVIIGAGAMVGMGSVVTKHLPPFAMAYGVPARVKGANLVGLSRAGFSEAESDEIAAALRAGDLLLLNDFFPVHIERFVALTTNSTNG